MIYFNDIPIKDLDRFKLLAYLHDDVKTIPQFKNKLKDIIAAYKAEREYKIQAEDAIDNIQYFSLCH